MITREHDMAKGARNNLSALNMCAHVGTHMDAPLHFIHQGAGIDAVPLPAIIGPCRVVEIRHPQGILPEELAGANLQPGERILFKTANSNRHWEAEPFNPDFVHIPVAGAQFLAQAGVQTVGVDYLSVGGYKRDGSEAHRVLLGAGIWIIEGLQLGQVSPGHYDLICLPIKLRDCDGAPARAVLRARSS